MYRRMILQANITVNSTKKPIHDWVSLSVITQLVFIFVSKLSES